MGEDDEEEKPGDTYEGNMEHGIRQGQGTYTWGMNGAVYVGEYVDNKKHGKGKMTFPDKGVYEGKGLWDRDEGAPSGRLQDRPTSAQQCQVVKAQSRPLQPPGRAHYAPVPASLMFHPIRPVKATACSLAPHWECPRERHAPAYP